MDKVILTELARAWRAKAEIDYGPDDGSDQANIRMAEHAAINRTLLQCSDDIEHCLKLFAPLGSWDD